MTPAGAVLAWLLLLAVAFLNGTVRQFAYPSTLGDFAARQVAAGVAAVAAVAAEADRGGPIAAHGSRHRPEPGERRRA